MFVLSSDNASLESFNDVISPVVDNDNTLVNNVEYASITLFALVASTSAIPAIALDIPFIISTIACWFVDIVFKLSICVENVEPNLVIIVVIAPLISKATFSTSTFFFFPVEESIVIRILSEPLSNIAIIFANDITGVTTLANTPIASANIL